MKIHKSARARRKCVTNDITGGRAACLQDRAGEAREILTSASAIRKYIRKWRAYGGYTRIISKVPLKTFRQRDDCFLAYIAVGQIAR